MTKNLKILSLPSREYVDRDSIMLHACFQILEDFINKEGGDNIIKDIPPEGMGRGETLSHNRFAREVNRLNAWWQERKKTAHGDDEEMDDKMLKRLIKIRRCLWT